MGGERISFTKSSNAFKSAPKKVMVVVDPTRESASALQYALSHAVVDNDEVVLLHVDNPNSWKNTITTFLKRPNNGGSANANAAADGGGGAAAEVDFLEEMKNVFQVAHPKMKVETARVGLEGKDKPAVIIAQTMALGIDLLVIGQRRSLSTALLGYKRSSAGGAMMKGTKMLDTAEYLIDNSKCTCVAVQKKGQNAGYLLNSKTHRNFWLLA